MRESRLSDLSKTQAKKKKRLILIEGSASLSAGQTHDSFLVFSVQNGV